MNFKELEKLVDQGESTYSIANYMNLSQTNIRYWLNKYNLKTKPKLKNKSKNKCKNCNNILERSKAIYCNSKCHRDFEYSEYIKEWKLGLKVGYKGKNLQLVPAIRKYMLSKTNNSCEQCTWNKLHPVDNKPLVEIDHIDGDASNCKEENLKVLCPNCHSMTPTFRARNKNSKRDRK